MTVREIAHVGHPVLRQRAREVSEDELQSDEVQRLIDDLIATKRAAHGAGIAAPQVHMPLRIAIVEVEASNPRYPYKPPAPLTVIVNPQLEALGGERYLNNEGCLSVPGLRGDLLRHRAVRVRALDRSGAPLVREVHGLTAGTYQHEVDHLDGMLFLDRVADSRTLATWEQFDRFHRDAFIARIRGLVEEEGS
jgi:peptide deformylase